MESYLSVVHLATLLSLSKHAWRCLYIYLGGLIFLRTIAYDITSLSLSTHKKMLISSASMDFIKIKRYIKDLIASDVLQV
jgi:hypothetical protein